MLAIAHRLKCLKERGDTLVEVMIAIGIISSILAGAYVVTNKSLVASRDAQERGNALKLSEGQIERIKTVVVSNPNAIFGTAAPASFCLDATNTPVLPTDNDCRVDASGIATTADPGYQLTVTRTGNTFDLLTTWTNVSGTGTSRVELAYKAYR